MRVALLAPLPTEQSGIADYAVAFCHALEASGIEVACPFSEQFLISAGSSFDQAMAQIDWREVNLVHAELGGGRFREFLALEWLAFHYPEIPLTATVHDPERLIWRPPIIPSWIRVLPGAVQKIGILLLDPLTLRREQKLATRLSALVALTQTGRDRLRERMQLLQDRVVTIPIGNQAVAPVSLPPLPPEAPLRLLYFGFIYRGKGIEDLIDALALLEKQKPGFSSLCSLTLAGGTQPDMTFSGKHSYLDFLRARLRNSGLAELSVTWKLDVPASDIPSLIQAHHVMVLPYRESVRLSFLGQMRGTSGALSWAAACGRSVITSNARAFSEEVSHGNGDVYPEGDVSKLAAAIDTLVERPTLLVARSDAAAQLGEIRSWKHTAQHFNVLFQQVLEEQNQS